MMIKGEKTLNRSNNLLTEGNIYKALIQFSVPFILANIIQALYGTVDLWAMGFFTDTAGLSGVATSTQVMQIVNGFITGLTMGATILVGQYYGARKEKDISDMIGTIFALGIIVSAIVALAMILSRDALVQILQTPSEAVNDAKNYILIASIGTFFIFGYNAISAILRGLGDSRRPVYFIGIASVFNIALDILLIGILDLRASGAALATVISQGISMALAMLYLSKKDFIFKFKLKNLVIDMAKAQKLLKLGLPLSTQEVLLWGSFLVIVAIANSMGIHESAAVGIVAKFETFSMLPPMALSYALAALTAQNIGAEKPERAKKALNVSIFISFLCSLAFFAWAQLHPQSIMKIFGANQAVALAGAEYLKIYSIDFMLTAFKFNLNGFLNGCGATTFTMLNGTVSSVLVRIPAAFIFGVIMSGGLIGLGVSVPIASILSITVSIIYIKKGNWQKVKTS